MNAPYPSPGQPYPPGYPPPRPGMGCFAKGCLVTVVVLLIVGVLLGIAGWYVYSSVRPFVSTEPVAIRTFSTTDAQYSETLGRVQAFQTSLANTHAATLVLSGDDLNTLIARAPSAGKSHVRMYFSMADNRVVVESCLPLSGGARGRSSTGQGFYFVGKLFCDVSFADGEFAIAVRKLETLGGQPASDFLTAIFTSAAFNQSASRSFNAGFRNALRQNSSGQDLLANVRTMTVRDNHLVIAAADR